MTWQKITLSPRLFYYKTLLADGFSIEVDQTKNGELNGWKVYHNENLVAFGKTSGVNKSKDAGLKWYESLSPFALKAIQNFS